MGGKQSSVEKSTDFSGRYIIHKFEYKWSVPDFKKLISSGVGSSTTSEVLCLVIDGVSHTFKLILYPNGYNDRVKNYLSVWLQKTSPMEKLVSFACVLLDAKEGEVFKKSEKKRLALESCLGWTTFCNKNVVLNEESEILSNGSLTLKCCLEVYSDEAIENPEVNPENEEALLRNMSNDLNQLLSAGDFHDVILKVDGQELRAHKAVLSARSNVFRTMLKSPLQERSKEIDIRDISEEVCKEMLNYIYSGKVPYLEFETASQLFYAADKYELNSLRNACSKVLEGNLDPEKAVSVLKIAERHSDKNLKEVCVQYIAKNATKIQERSEWVDLLKLHPEVANLVFKRLAV